jgi:hypothetical protein
MRCPRLHARKRSKKIEPLFRAVLDDDARISGHSTTSGGLVSLR